MRLLIPLCLTLTAAAAPAAERKLLVSSFERLRVDGPVRVVVTAGRSPAGVVSGDPGGTTAVEVRQEGDTVFVRRVAGAADPAASPVTVTLATPSLAAVYLVGAGAVSVAGIQADRVDLSVAGTGTIAVAGANAGDLNATTIGTGRITLAGRAARARFIVNGVGGIAADQLDAGALTVRLDGPGEVAGRARFTADVTSTGQGRVAVAGSAKCVVKTVATALVSCGAAAVR